MPHRDWAPAGDLQGRQPRWISRRCNSVEKVFRALLPPHGGIREDMRMLTCYGHTCRLPRGDLTYVAFRTAALATLDDLDWVSDDLEAVLNAGTPIGFLSAVPLLANLDPIVQLDLLGDVWSRQRPRRHIEATLLDAAVVYAACETIRNLLSRHAARVQMYLREAPRSVRAKVDIYAAEKFEALFERFWDDLDFLTLSEWQDLPSAHSGFLKRYMNMADDSPLFDALKQGTVSKAFRKNLHGVLTDDEVDEALAFGRRTGSVPARSAQ